MIDKIQRSLINDLLQNRENLIVDMVLALQNASCLSEARSTIESFVKHSNVRRDDLNKSAEKHKEMFLPKQFDVWSNLIKNQFTMTLSKDTNQCMFPYGFPLFVMTIEAVDKVEAFKEFGEIMKAKKAKPTKSKDIGFGWNETIQNNLS